MTADANRTDAQMAHRKDPARWRGAKTPGTDEEHEPLQCGHERPCAPGSEALRPLARALLAAAAAELRAGRADLPFRTDGASIDEPGDTGTAEGA